MSATVDRATVIANALAKLAVNPVALDADNPGDPRAARILRLYDNHLRYCLGLHAWGWQKRTLELDAVDKASEGLAESDNWPAGWQYAHVLPGGYEFPPLALLRSPAAEDKAREHELQDDRVYSGHSRLWAVLRLQASNPEIWPQSWRAAFEVSLAGALAIPETQNEGLANRYERQAHGAPVEAGTGGMFGRLIAQDLAGNPPDSPLRYDPLTSPATRGPWFGRN